MSLNSDIGFALELVRKLIPRCSANQLRDFADELQDLSYELCTIADDVEDQEEDRE